MTPTEATHGPGSDNGRQDAPGATDTATEAREAIDLDAIEARAKAATPGPWEAHGLEGQVRGNSTQVVVDGITMWAETDAQHIAGMDPATTLALVRELREARAEVERLRGELANADKPAPCDMRREEPHDFAYCDTHDTTFALGSKCEWDGVESIIEHLDDKERAQRGRAVLAEIRAEAAEAERDDLRARLAKVEDTECCASGSCEVCRPGIGGWGDR